MKEYNSTANNVKIGGKWANKNKKFWLSFPIDKKDKESIFAKIIIPSLFVFISYRVGWIYGIAYLVVVILFDKIENKKMSRFFSGLLRLSNNNSSQFNQNFMLSPQNQNFQYPSSSPLTLEEILGSGLSIKRFFSLQDIADFYRAEIAELRNHIEKLEQKSEQQVIPIQFLDSEKLELKQPLYVALIYSPSGEEWIADCPELNVYGNGKDEAEAIKDFKIALEESYFSLKKDKDKLGPLLEKEWRIFNKIIEEK